MNSQSHVVLGFGTALVGLSAAQAFGISDLNTSEIVTAAIIAGVGSLMPDIDHHGSIMNRTALPIMIAGAALLFLGLHPPQSMLDALWLTSLQSFMPSISLQGLLGWSLIIGAIMLIVIPVVTEHRGLTHSWAICVIMGFVAVGYYSWSGLPIAYGFCYAWGWTSHLLADLTTEMGLPNWGWPVTEQLEDILDIGL